MVRERPGWSGAGLHDREGAVRTSAWSVDALGGAVRQRPRLAGLRREERHPESRRAPCAPLQRPVGDRRAGARAAQPACAPLRADRAERGCARRALPPADRPVRAAGRKAHRRRREGRRRSLRLQRGHVPRRQHRADRRPPRQRRRRRCVGVHTRERKMDPAGPEAHRQRRGRHGRIRQERGAVRGIRKQNVRGDRRARRQRRRRRRVGPRAHGRSVDPAGHEAHGKSRGRDRSGRIRLERRARGHQRRIRAGRRPRRQRKNRRGVGLPAHGDDLGSAGRQTRRKSRGRDRSGRIRQERGAVPGWRLWADGRPGRQRKHRRRVDLPAHGHDLGPAGETRRKSRGRDRRRLVRLQRRALRRSRKQNVRADRCPQRQRQRRHGVGLPAHDNHVDPAGETRRHRGDRHGRIRQERGARRHQRRIRADRRPRRQRRHRRGVGLPAHGHELGPAGETRRQRGGRRG